MEVVEESASVLVLTMEDERCGGETRASHSGEAHDVAIDLRMDSVKI